MTPDAWAFVRILIIAGGVAIGTKFAIVVALLIYDAMRWGV